MKKILRYRILLLSVFVLTFAFSTEIVDTHDRTLLLIDQTISKPVVIRNSSHITVDCNGSKLTMTDPTSGIFKIYNSRDITIKNCVIDYSILPHVAGKIEKIDKRKREITFKPFKSYAGHIKQNIEKKAKKTKIYIYPLQYPGVPKAYGTAVTEIRHIAPSGEKVYTLQSKKIKGYLRRGDTIVVVFRTQGGSIVFMRNSKHILIQGLTIYSSPAANFVGLNTSKLTIKKCKILLRKGRWISTNGGGINIQSSRGNINIDKNIFEGLGDDGVNLYTTAFFVKKDAKGYFLWKSGYISKILKPKDTIYVFNWDRGDIRKSRIKKIIKRGKKTYLSFTPPLTVASNDRLYDMELVSNNFTITNNIFKKSRRFGIVLKAHHGIIKNNYFNLLGGSALVMKNANPKFFNEGLNCEDIHIVNNVFLECGFGQGKERPAIKIYENCKLKNKEIPFHRNVYFYKNTFSPISIYISNVKDLNLTLIK